MSRRNSSEVPLRRRGTPRPWSWLLTGAIIGFALLGGYAMTTPNKNEATGASYSATTSIMFMGVFGAFLGALLAALVLAIVVGRRR